MNLSQKTCLRIAYRGAAQVRGGCQSTRKGCPFRQFFGLKNDMRLHVEAIPALSHGSFAQSPDDSEEGSSGFFARGDPEKA